MPLFLVTYGTVFAAEIAGDKLLYTTGVLATRYRAMPIACGMALAFMVKMGAAVMAGEAVSSLPPVLVAAVTTTSFLWLAYTLWRKDDTRRAPSRDDRASSAALVSFAAVVFSEWGDVGQITAATLTARFGSPFTIWLGAVAAMVTKGALAASFGAGIRNWIHERVPSHTAKYGSVIFLLVLGIFSTLEVLLRTH